MLTAFQDITKRLKNNRLLPLVITTLVASLAFTACDDTLTNGQSLVDDEINIYIDTTFSIQASTLQTDSVQSRTVLNLLGEMDIQGYGTLSSDFITQFMPSARFDTTGVRPEYIDSVTLVMRYVNNGFIGDSVPPMGISVYPVTKQLPSPIFSNFNPTGYYNPNECYGQAIYSALRVNLDDIEAALTYRQIDIKLPHELALSFYNEYLTNPSTYQNPESFAKYFPGLYLKSSYGSGRIVQIARTAMALHYHTFVKTSDGRDSLVAHTGNYFAVTPEITCNNNIRYTPAQSITERIDQGQSLLIAPIGANTEIKFPTEQILQKYRQTIAGGLGVINSLRFSIPCEEITNNASITPPPYILMVLKKDFDQFFNKNQLTDNKTSFYATYDSNTNTYDIGEMREYILAMADKESLTAEDYTFIICPVLVSTETQSDYWGSGSSAITAITPYVEKPVMCRLLPEKAKIKFTFARQSLVK